MRIKIFPEELVECLDDAGYHFYITDKEFRHGINRPKRLSTCIKPKDYFFKYQDDFLLFVNVSSKDVRYLKRVMKSIALQRNPSVIIRLRFLKRKIKSFFNTDSF